MEHTREILLVGGNSGIGRAVVEKLLARGDRVTALCRSPDDLIGLGVDVHSFDANGEDAVSVPLPEQLDGVVYCPGSITLKPFHRTTGDDFLGDYRINVLGAVRVLQAALPALKRADGASVVLFGSVAAAIGMGFHASIATAKAGVEGLARSLAAEWAPRIRVNAIAPSLTDTPLAGDLLATAERREAAAKRHPLGRLGDADGIADLAVYLLSPAAGFVTGQVLRVDGGISGVRTFS